MAQHKSSNEFTSPNPARVVGRNIEALLAVQQQTENEKRFDERLADAVTRFAGSMTFVYLHLVIFGLWILINVGWLPFKRFDPSLVVLAMIASVEAIFLSTFILISQNRMQELADKRADLNLHVSLLSEHEITRLITLTSAIAARMDIEEAADPELFELAKDVRPEEVLAEIEQSDNRS